MCTEQEFIDIFNPERGPIKIDSIWIDKKGCKVQVIKSDSVSVQVIRDTIWTYTSGKKGFFRFGEFTLNFFLYIFDPVIK